MSLCNLNSFYDKFENEGVTRIEDIEDISASKLREFGLSDTQCKRLQRHFHQWNRKCGTTAVIINKPQNQPEVSRSSLQQTSQSQSASSNQLPEKQISADEMQQPSVNKQETSSKTRETESVSLGHGFFTKLGGQTILMKKELL